MAIVEITLDVTKPQECIEKIEGRQGDTATIVRATILNDGEPYDFVSGKYLELALVRPDGAWVHLRENVVQHDGNVWDATLPVEATASDGLCKLCYFVVRKNDDVGYHESTQRFMVDLDVSATAEAHLGPYSDQVDKLVAEAEAVIAAWEAERARQRAAFEAEQAARAEEFAAAQRARAADFIAAQEARTDAFNAALEDCEKQFTASESARQEAYDVAEAARQTVSEAAVTRANNAAKRVEDAVTGELDPLFKGWIDDQKNVEGGLVGYDKYLQEMVVADESTLHKSGTSLSIANGGVSASKLAEKSVTTGKLADTAVTEAKLATNAVTAGKIASGAVSTAKLSDGAVTAAKLSPRSVTPEKIDERVFTEFDYGKALDGAGYLDLTNTGPFKRMFSGLNYSYVKVPDNWYFSHFETSDGLPVFYARAAFSTTSEKLVVILSVASPEGVVRQIELDTGITKFVKSNTYMNTQQSCNYVTVYPSHGHLYLVAAVVPGGYIKDYFSGDCYLVVYDIDRETLTYTSKTLNPGVYMSLYNLKDQHCCWLIPAYASIKASDSLDKDINIAHMKFARRNSSSSTYTSKKLDLQTMTLANETLPEADQESIFPLGDVSWASTSTGYVSSMAYTFFNNVTGVTGNVSYDRDNGKYLYELAKADGDKRAWFAEGEAFTIEGTTVSRYRTDGEAFGKITEPVYKAEVLFNAPEGATIDSLYSGKIGNVILFKYSDAASTPRKGVGMLDMSTMKMVLSGDTAIEPNGTAISSCERNRAAWSNGDVCVFPTYQYTDTLRGSYLTFMTPKGV